MILFRDVGCIEKQFDSAFHVHLEALIYFWRAPAFDLR